MSESGERPGTVEIFGRMLKRDENDLIIHTVEILSNKSRRVLKRFVELDLVALLEKWEVGDGRLKPPSALALRNLGIRFSASWPNSRRFL